MNQRAGDAWPRTPCGPSGEARWTRVAQHLLAVRLKQLRERATAGRRSGQAGAGSWTDRLPELAARPLDGDTAGAVIA
ncbi:hypothetical protein [Streptomyces sp. NPDC001770]